MNSDLETPESNEPFEERIAELIHELELSVKWDRPSILFAIYRSEHIRAEAEAILADRLTGLKQKTVRIHASDEKNLDLLEKIRTTPELEQTVLFIDGFKWECGPEGARVFKEVNKHREYFIDNSIRAVFWLFEDEVQNFANNATECWILRHRVVEFTDAPRPVQNLIQTLDRVWDGMEEAGRPADPLPLPALEQILEQSLPDGPEAAAIHANILLTLGLLYWRKGSQDQAQRTLQAARQIAHLHEDEALEVQCNNALALVGSGQPAAEDQAEAESEAELEIPWGSLASLLAGRERNEEAVSAFKKAIEHEPENFEHWTGLGQVYRRMNLQQNAVAAFQEALELAPNADGAWAGLAGAYQDGSQPDLALGAWRRATELNPASLDAWLQLAALCAAQDRTDQAICAYQKAAELDPQRPCTWKELGSLYIKTGAYTDAVETFSKLAALRPDCGFALSSLAYAHYKVGSYDEAVRLFEQSIPLFAERRSQAAIWYRLGDTYRKRKEFDNALAAYKQAELLLQPESTPEPVAVIETPSVESADGPAAEVQPAAEPLEQPQVLILESAADAEAEIVEAIDRIDPQLFAVSPDEPAAAGTEDQAVEVNMTEQESMPALEATGLETLNREREDLDNRDAAAWNALGNEYLRSGAFDEAISAYTKAIELQPDFNWPYISNLAMAHYQKGISCGQNEPEAETAPALPALLETAAPPARLEPVQVEANADLLQPAPEPYDQQELEVWLTQMESRLAAATARSEVLPEAAPAATNEEPAVCPCLAEAEPALNLSAASLEIPEDAPQIVPQDAAPAVEIPAGLLPDDADALHVTPADQVLVETVVVEDETASRPGNSIDWNELGNAYTRNGAYDDAIHAYKQSIRLNPRYGSPYSNLGFVYFHKGEYQIAVSLYKKSLQLLESAEDKATCWNRLGDTYRRMRDYNNAMKAYEKAGNADPVTTPLLARARVALMSNAAD